MFSRRSGGNCGKLRPEEFSKRCGNGGKTRPLESSSRGSRFPTVSIARQFPRLSGGVGGNSRSLASMVSAWFQRHGFFLASFFQKTFAQRPLKQ